MLLKILDELNLPPLLPREEMLKILQEEIFGYMPPKPESISFEVEEDIIPKFCAGKAICNKITAKCVVKGKEFSFPFFANLPTDNEKHPFFIHINFRDLNPDRYMPTEEIIDNGFAVFSVYYNDISSDDDDFTSGLAGILFPNGKRNTTDPGKIAMWAWATGRIMDYAQTLTDKLLTDCGTVCGHSRLGKTALLAGATDERFKFAYSNDSGCSGASLARWTRGETVKEITDRFPFWFCENYNKYRDNESEMPFDQHYLIASIAPRHAVIGSASEDLWADPRSEMLSCVAASPAFENGFKYENRFPEINDMFFEGDIGYHMRKGLHYFSREDWNKLITYINSHR